jgi:hypothetical protein
MLEYFQFGTVVAFGVFELEVRASVRRDFP